MSPPANPDSPPPPLFDNKIADAYEITYQIPRRKRRTAKRRKDGSAKKLDRPVSTGRSGNIFDVLLGVDSGRKSLLSGGKRRNEGDPHRKSRRLHLQRGGNGNLLLLRSSGSGEYCLSCIIAAAAKNNTYRNRVCFPLHAGKEYPE